MIRTQRPLNSWDLIKILGLVLMLVDHSSVFFFQEQLLRAIGRSAAPIFLFLAGFAASYRLKWDLLALAVLLSLSDLLLTGQLRTQNILFAIILWRLLFQALEERGLCIERPYEWYIGCVALLSTMLVVQYGTLGLLFAICGYMKRHPDRYPQAQQRIFFLLAFATYGIIQIWASGFSLLESLVMAIGLLLLYRLLLGFEIREAGQQWPTWLRALAKLTARGMAYIYAFHLIALEWMTGIPF